MTSSDTDFCIYQQVNLGQIISTFVSYLGQIRVLFSMTATGFWNYLNPSLCRGHGITFLMSVSLLLMLSRCWMRSVFGQTELTMLNPIKAESKQVGKKKTL